MKRKDLNNIERRLKRLLKKIDKNPSKKKYDELAEKEGRFYPYPPSPEEVKRSLDEWLKQRLLEIKKAEKLRS